MAPKTPPSQQTFDQRVPKGLQAPVMIALGLLGTVALWTLRLGFPDIYVQLKGQLIAALSIAGPALLALGIFELLYTPDPPPPPSPAAKGKARMSVGMDAMLEDIEGRKAWVRRIAAIAIGVVHYLFVSLSG